jgi:Sec-independent protein secretion pathway component TatC
MFLLYALIAFALGAFFGYFGLIVLLEYYESQRPGPHAEDRRSIHKTINRCALWGGFVIGLISLGLYLSH